MKVTNIQPVQTRPIPWGWKNMLGADGTLWVSQSPGEICMPRLIKFFDWGQWIEKAIPELECSSPTIVSTNMKSVYTTATRFLGIEETLMRMHYGTLDLRGIFREMMAWAKAVAWYSPKKIERIIVGDDVGMNTGMIMSPALYEKELLPFHKTFAQHARENRIDPWFHSDGDISAILPMLKKAGYSGIYYEDCNNMKEALIKNDLMGIEVVR